MNPHADRDASEQPGPAWMEPVETDHVHDWQRHQNVTSKGYALPPYEACGCGAARTVEPSVPTATPDAGTTRVQEVEALRAALDERNRLWGHRSRELGDLRAEVDRLRQWKSEALPVLSGLQEVGQALGLPLGSSITGRAAVDAALDLRNRAEAAEAIVEQVRALGAHVRELHAELPEPHGAFTRGYDTALRDILAVLDGAQTPQTTRQTRDVAAGAPGSVSGGTETGEALVGAQGGEERWWNGDDCDVIRAAIADGEEVESRNARFCILVEAMGPTVERIRREAIAEGMAVAADLVKAEEMAETRRLSRHDDQSGLLANWIGGIRNAEKLIRARIEAD